MHTQTGSVSCIVDVCKRNWLVVAEHEYVRIACASCAYFRQWSHPPSAENVTVGEKLSGQVTDGQPGEHNFGSTVCAFLELVVDDVPLSVDDALIFGRVVQPNLWVHNKYHE